MRYVVYAIRELFVADKQHNPTQLVEIFYKLILCTVSTFSSVPLDVALRRRQRQRRRQQRQKHCACIAVTGQAGVRASCIRRCDVLVVRSFKMSACMRQKLAILRPVQRLVQLHLHRALFSHVLAQRARETSGNSGQAGVIAAANYS